MPRRRVRSSGGIDAGVRSVEEVHVLLDVVGLFKQRLVIPLAPLGVEEVAAIDVDGAGQPAQGIVDRVDDIGAKRGDILGAERGRARGADLPTHDD